MKSYWVLSLAVLLSLGLVACGPSAEPASSTQTAPSSSGTDSSSTSPAATPEASMPAMDKMAEYNTETMVMLPKEQEAASCEPGKEIWRSEGAPIRGGTWTQSGSSPTIDFTKGSAVGLSAIPQVYDMLLRPRICYAEDNMVEPALAKSWEISADGLSWTLNLRDDVKWHDKSPVNGRQFVSSDVAWTIDFQVEQGVLRSFWADVSHTEPDHYTIKLKLDKPNADFLQQLAFHTNIMLAHEVFEQDGDFKSRAIGTGSFMLQEFRSGQSAKLVRNPAYYRMGADGLALPYIDEVRSIALADRAATSAAVRSGQLDYGSAANRLEVDEFREKFSDQFRVYLPRQGSVHAVWVHGEKKPGNDVRVRQAISFAIKREDITLGSRQGGATLSGFIPQAVSYSWQDAKLKEKFPHDPEKAKALLAEAGYQPGDLKFQIHTTGSYAQDAAVVLENFKTVGIDAEINIRDMGVGSGGGSSRIVAKGDYEIAWAVLAPTFFPSYWARGIVHSESVANITRVKDAKVDSLADAQQKELDPVKRAELIEQQQERLWEIMAFVPVQSLFYTPVDSCKIRNLKPKHYTYQREGLIEAWIDPAGTCP